MSVTQPSIEFVEQTSGSCCTVSLRFQGLELIEVPHKGSKGFQRLCTVASALAAELPDKPEDLLNARGCTT